MLAAVLHDDFVMSKDDSEDEEVEPYHGGMGQEQPELWASTRRIVDLLGIGFAIAARRLQSG